MGIIQNTADAEPSSLGLIFRKRRKPARSFAKFAAITVLLALFQSTCWSQSISVSDTCPNEVAALVRYYQKQNRDADANKDFTKYSQIDDKVTGLIKYYRDYNGYRALEPGVDIEQGLVRRRDQILYNLTKDSGYTLEILSVSLKAIDTLLSPAYKGPLRPDEETRLAACMLRQAILAKNGGTLNNTTSTTRQNTNTQAREPARDQPSRPTAPTPTTDGPTTAQEREQLANQTKAQQYQKQAEYGRKTLNDPRKHKPEMMADHCLVKSPIGKSAPYNKCDFKVEAVMCMYRPNYKIYERAFFELGGAFDCEKKQGGMWTVAAGSHVSGQWHGEYLNWFVCRKPSTPFAEYSLTKKTLIGRCD